MSSPPLQPRKRIPAILAAVALALLAVAGVVAVKGPASNASAKPATRTVLKVGNQKGGTHAIMQAAGVLDDTPYRIEWSLFPAASPLLEALGAGAVDVGGVGDAPYAFAFSSGSKIRAVMATRQQGDDRVSAIVVPAGSPIRTPKDLKGKRIGTIRGSAGHDLALRVLEREGLTAKDVSFVFLNNGDSKAALAKGAIDAWSTWSSYVGIALLQDKDRIVADATNLKRSVGFQVASEAAVTDKREALTDFLNRLARAERWVETHRDAYAAMLAKETGLPPDVARFTAGSVAIPVPIDAQLVKDQHETFERYVRAGVIDRVPDLTHAYDPSFSEGLTP